MSKKFSVPDANLTSTAGQAMSERFSVPDVNLTSTARQVLSEKFYVSDVNLTSTARQAMSKKFSVPDVNLTSTARQAVSEKFSVSDVNLTLTARQAMSEKLSVPDVEMNSFSSPDVKFSSQAKITKPSSLSEAMFMPVRSGEFFRQKYKKLEEIGTGGFGTVWKGLRTADSTPVAIKVTDNY